MKVCEFVPFLRAGPVHLGASREDVRAAIDMPLSRGTRFYWTETFGEPGGPRWFVGYDELGKVVHVEAHPSFDPVEIPAAVTPGLTRREVWNCAGPPSIPIPARDYFFENNVSVAVAYDDAFEVDFVEVSGPVDVVLNGLHLLTTLADEVLACIPHAQAQAGSRTEPTFPEIGLALYREAVPEENPDDETLLYFASAALARRGYWC